MIDYLLQICSFFFTRHNWWTGVVWITCGLLWCFYQLFKLSFWRHPFTAEDSLLSKGCNTTFLQICFLELTNSSNILHGLRVRKCSANFHFCVNYSFSVCVFMKGSAFIFWYLITESLTSNFTSVPSARIVQKWHRRLWKHYRPQTTMHQMNSNGVQRHVQLFSLKFSVQKACRHGSEWWSSNTPYDTGPYA